MRQVEPIARGTYGLIPQDRTAPRLAIASYLDTQVRFLTQMASILTNVIHGFPESLKIYHGARWLKLKNASHLYTGRGPFRM
jgi:hypothetical protein